MVKEEKFLTIDMLVHEFGVLSPTLRLNSFQLSWLLRYFFKKKNRNTAKFLTSNKATQNCF